ncbi:hypothetical protein F2Q70_00007469 [Brassica cretica]|uniref:Uncharacterized protein n=1 Tax=Brassica cretica TaxID=69181 RepID=A0A8S9M7X4_BRACR|nr:hypothetical protein F2Q70_00007469 [Brassica cretica]
MSNRGVTQRGLKENDLANKSPISYGSKVQISSDTAQLSSGGKAVTTPAVTHVDGGISDSASGQHDDSGADQREVANMEKKIAMKNGLALSLSLR